MVKLAALIEQLQQRFAKYVFLIVFAVSINNLADVTLTHYLLNGGMALIVFSTEFFNQDLAYYDRTMRDMKYGTEKMNSDDNLKLFHGVIERTIFFRLFGVNNFIDLLIAGACSGVGAYIASMECSPMTVVSGPCFLDIVCIFSYGLVFLMNLLILLVKLWCNKKSSKTSPWLPTESDASKTIAPSARSISPKIAYMFILTGFTWGGYEHLSKVAPYLKLRDEAPKHIPEHRHHRGKKKTSAKASSD